MIRKPSNWHTFSVHQKLCYLVNTRQARSFKEAGRLLGDGVRRKVEPVVMRLPYRDN